MQPTLDSPPTQPQLQAAATAPPMIESASPKQGFHLARYFTISSLAAFLLILAPLIYLERVGNEFFSQVLRDQNRFFKQVQHGFARQQDETARRDLLSVYEAGSVNLTRLFANTLWQKDFGPFVHKAQHIQLDACRAIADVQDSAGKPAPPAAKKACFAAVGKQIMALPKFPSLDARTRDLMKNSTVFKIKVYDLRGITVYSSQHSQIGEDKTGNAGWQSAMAGKPASELTHRGKFGAFEGVVENRDLIESYVPILAPGNTQVVGALEIYSDVTPFLEHIKSTTAKIQQLNAGNQAQLDRAVAANEAEAGRNGNLLLAIVFGLLVLLWGILFLIVRHGQRVIDRERAERKRAEQTIRESAQGLRLFTDNVPAMTVSFNANLLCLFANKQYALFFGFDPANISGKHLRELVGEEAYHEIEGYFAQVLKGRPVTYQRTRKLPSGESRYIEVKLLPHIGEQEKMLGCFAVITDITEHKLTQERIQQVAHHDSLTGLPNRLLFNDRLQQAISLAKRDSRQLALLYLDLDRFKQVNDSLGHAAGDELLQAVASRLRQQVRESDTVARVGGDEFNVILTNVAERGEAEIVAHKIIAALTLPFELKSVQQVVEIGASIGIALYPANAKDADALIKAADAAMYNAKQIGNSFRFYAA